MPATKTREEVNELIIDTLVSFGPDRSEVQPQAALADLDIDSLDIVELGQVLTAECGITIPMDAVKEAEPRTVDDLLQLVGRHVDQ